MKISLHWLKRYISLECSAEEIERALTMIGFEVEGVTRLGLPPLPQVVVGEVLSRDQHPNADRLSVCRVNVGSAGGEKSIVCGAQNYKVGDRVPVALPGAVLPGDFRIKSSKLRGVLSEGMMCSAREIGYAEDAEGLLILEERPAVGTPLNQIFTDSDVVFDIEVTPNRPDCLCHVGIARELAAYFGRELTAPLQSGSRMAEAGAARCDLLQSVEVTAEEDCPLYTAHIISGVKIGPSPLWLQRALRAVGLRPINNVVDVTNFVLLELGQPLHAFDAGKLSGGQLVVRRARDGEKLTTLDGKERILSSRMLVIADAARPLVVAGIMGGVDAEVDDSTTDVVLEAAFFRPASVRWTSRKLGIWSDSSYRFERGVDPFGPAIAAGRAIDLILQVAGGRLEDPVYRLGTEPIWQSEIQLSPQFIRRKAGFDIPDATIQRVLELLGLGVSAGEPGPSSDEEIWTVRIPSYRSDLGRPIDLVEEVIRIHGTDKIPAAAVWVPAIPGEDDPLTQFERRASAYLVGQHFYECVNYTLRSGPELARWVSHAAEEELALANPLSADQSHLRTTLISGLLDALLLNQSRQTGGRRVFECGRVFKEVNGQVWECCAVAFAIQIDPDERSWLKREAPDFFTAKSHVLALAAAAGLDLGAAGFEPVAGIKSAWQEGHSAVVGALAEGYEAHLGLLNLALVRELGLKGTVLAGTVEILPERLRQQPARGSFEPYSLFPAAVRDLAVVVDEALFAEKARSTIADIARGACAESCQLESASLFDVYVGTGLPAGKKSLAVSLSFRAADRTLTDEEVNAMFLRVQQEVESAAGYALRR